MPRRIMKATPPADAIYKEAAGLARQAELRLRLSDTADVHLEDIANPIDRLEAVLDIADRAAKTASTGEVENWLPCGPWWRKRLQDLREGRTFQIRKIVYRDGVPVNVPVHPDGDPR